MQLKDLGSYNTEAVNLLDGNFKAGEDNLAEKLFQNFWNKLNNTKLNHPYPLQFALLINFW